MFPPLQEGTNALTKTLVIKFCLIKVSLTLVCLGDPFIFFSFIFPHLFEGRVNNMSTWINKIVLKNTGQLHQRILTAARDTDILCLTVTLEAVPC